MAIAIIFKFKNRHIFGKRYCITVPPCPDIIWGTAFLCVPLDYTTVQWRPQLFQIQQELIRR